MLTEVCNNKYPVHLKFTVFTYSASSADLVTFRVFQVLAVSQVLTLSLFMLIVDISTVYMRQGVSVSVHQMPWMLNMPWALP